MAESKSEFKRVTTLMRARIAELEAEQSAMRVVIEAAQEMLAESRPWPQGGKDSHWTLVRMKDYDATLTALRALDVQGGEEG